MYVFLVMKRLNRFTIGPLLIVFSAEVLGQSTFAQAVPGQKDPYTISVDLDLVVLAVSVLNSKGQLVSGLGEDQFSIYEDSQPQEISLFRKEDAPASVGLLVDNSLSMGNKHADVRDSVLAFVDTSNSSDEMFVLFFNEEVRAGLPDAQRMTSDKKQLREALRRFSPGGQTALYDALWQGMDYLAQADRNRKVLVVFSDGGDNVSRHSFEQALRRAEKSDATIYTVGIYDALDRDRRPGVLKRIANVTGGKSRGQTTESCDEELAGTQTQLTQENSETSALPAIATPSSDL